MSVMTEISWTDATFNPWIGCTKVSPGCDHCYAERDFAIRKKRVTWGAGAARSRTSEANWRLPLRWNARDFMACPDCHWRGDVRECTWSGEACPECGAEVEAARRRVFCASLADWLDNEAPIEWLADLLDLIRLTPNLDWLLLSKRVGNWHKRLHEAWASASRTGNYALHAWIAAWTHGSPPPNVWLGATIVNQAEADRDIPKLLAVPAPVRFLSMEPLLGEVNLRRLPIENPVGSMVIGALPANAHIDALRGYVTNSGQVRVDWVIAGGESGPHARPSHPDWFRMVRDQCAAAGAAFHFKQWGEWLPFYDRDRDDPDWRNVPKLDNQMGRGSERWINLAGGLGFHGGRLIAMRNVGKPAAGRLLDDREHNEFPQVVA